MAVPLSHEGADFRIGGFAAKLDELKSLDELLGPEAPGADVSGHVVEVPQVERRTVVVTETVLFDDPFDRGWTPAVHLTQAPESPVGRSSPPTETSPPEPGGLDRPDGTPPPRGPALGF